MIVNPQNGKRERIYVNLEAIYPTPEEPGTELSFEELWAASRGWLDFCWDDGSLVDYQDPVADENVPSIDVISRAIEGKLVIHKDNMALDENGTLKDHHPRTTKGRKKKIMEVNETQISTYLTCLVPHFFSRYCCYLHYFWLYISMLYSHPFFIARLLITSSTTVKANLDSPSGPKMKKKRATLSEPTMTIHTKAATDDIYDLFNAPLKSTNEDSESDEDEYMTDGDYTSGAESTGTTRQISTSEAGDDETADDETADDETADDKSISEWSDFTARKHIPKVDGEDEYEPDEDINSDLSDLIDASNAQEPGDEGDDDIPPTPEDSPPRTRFIPIPPEDYEPPTRPYRDPAEVANNRLPFMTPITERTETSVGMFTEAKSTYFSKTPSKLDTLDSTAEEDEDEDEDDEDLEPLSSPLRDVSDDTCSPVKLPQPQLSKPKPSPKAPVPSAIPKGPIIKEAQCNPVDKVVRGEILAKMHPPLASYPGFYDHRNERSDRGTEIRRYTKTAGKNGKNSNEKTGPIQIPVVLEFPELLCEYTLKRELGSGAYAPVYLVENSSPENGEEDGVVEMGKGVFATRQRASLEALKMEQPPTAWEFFIMRLAADRLGPHHRATASISAAHELHLYQDEGFLLLPFHPYPTLLSVINFFREQPSGIMDEMLAMFFTIELLRTVEALHAKQILHGDLKVDNCLLRLDDTDSLSQSQNQGQGLANQWLADGSGSWSTRGVVLIDFGRGIDMRAFEKDVQFVADWKTTKEDCAEVREGRPWTWQIDYHGLAGIVHCLLFGKYIETVRADQGGLGTAAGRKYRIRESLKRYWQTDIWADCFDVLLNPGSHVEGEAETRLPINRGLRRIRERMEAWLEANCEKGIGLRAMLNRVEGWARSRKN